MEVLTHCLTVLGLLSGVVFLTSAIDVDPNGYILYCPCMGRFGNQADMFLGTLAFARKLNRTLVLPAWIEYEPRVARSVQIPFDTYFKVDPLREYHRMMLMEDFMKELAPSIWPVGKRWAFCYSARHGSDKEGCNAKEGNPFGPFWDNYDVDFDGSRLYGPLHYNLYSSAVVREWNEKYPSSEYPVLAFTGAPASFPVLEEHVKLQRYVQWSDSMANKAQDFIDKNVPDKPFLGLHMRNGIDFKNACEHMKDSPNLFSIAQCIGYRGQHGKGTYEMCYPDDKTVIAQMKKEVKRIGAKTVFIATDDRDLISQFSKAMKKVKFVRQPAPSSPMLDLAILSRADHFVGNCVSSFTAFVKRSRDAENKSSSFWAFPPPKVKDKEEL